MTKNVLVHILGRQREKFSGEEKMDLRKTVEETSLIETKNKASYYFKKGSHYILYEEPVEDFQGVIKNRIKITGNDKVEIKKSGLTDSHMIFEEGKNIQSLYRTPYGEMLMGVDTRQVLVRVEEEQIEVKLVYEIWVNEEPLSDCEIVMNIVPAE